MSTDVAEGLALMSGYERWVWDTVTAHWQRRGNRRGLPNWASGVLDRTGTVARDAASRATAAVPETVREPSRRTGHPVAGVGLRLMLKAAVSTLDLVNGWALELSDPRGVEKLARSRGLELDSFLDLRRQDLKVCDRLLTRTTLTWLTAGALEGSASGVVALVPGPGFPAAVGVDVLVVQVMSTSIASRIAYSYGVDARDPGEQIVIERLARRSCAAQAVKVEPLRRTARAAQAVNGRVNWSAELRADHRLLAELEKVMQRFGSPGARVGVRSVAKAVPVVGALIGAGVNSAVLGAVAADARRYCQTRFLCEKYKLPVPAAAG